VAGTGTAKMVGGLCLGHDVQDKGLFGRHTTAVGLDSYFVLAKGRGRRGGNGEGERDHSIGQSQIRRKPGKCPQDSRYTVGSVKADLSLIVEIPSEHNRKGKTRAALYSPVVLQEVEAVAGTGRIFRIRSTADLICIGEVVVIIVSQRNRQHGNGRAGPGTASFPIFKIGVVVGQESPACVREIRLCHQGPGPFFAGPETTQSPGNLIPDLNPVIAGRNKGHALRQNVSKSHIINGLVFTRVEECECKGNPPTYSVSVCL